MERRVHPGLYIRSNVIPPEMSVTEAARLLGVGRPALSNLLNGKAGLSARMAARLEKAFGVSQKDLLERQAEFEQHQQRAHAPNLAVGAYVPPFLKITARDIEQWTEGNLEARSHLAVLLRRLVNSTGQELSLVDFPGYGNAERKGWDGRVDAGVATPWIPLGKSRWEFGCSEDPRQKANSDYKARVGAIPESDRLAMDFVFVTPRSWSGKGQWAQDNEARGEWKSVRVYDASDLEQWLEQSIQAQGWLAERMGHPADGVRSLEDLWQEWSAATTPELPRELFTPSVERYKGEVKEWLERSPSSPLIVCGDSKLEALAFLYCLFESDDQTFGMLKDRALVFSEAKMLRKLATTSSSFVPIVFTDEAERELARIVKSTHTIVIRPRNTVDPEPSVVLDLLGHEPFRVALAAMGIDDHLRADDLARQSGHSPTILRRLLSKIPAIQNPEWAKDARAVRSLVPMMFVGAWHAQSEGDRGVMSLLTDRPYDKVEQEITELVNFDDPPVWCAGTFRGVVSKIDAFFAVQRAVTRKDLEDFLLAAEFVLSEKDPALDLPEDKRAFAGIYGKVREHSGALRTGVCETLVLLGIHGNGLFGNRLGVDVQAEIDALIRRLLTPLTTEKLLSQTRDLPAYAEAAPLQFLQIIEDDLRSDEPKVLGLLKPADTDLFGGGCPRTGLLWALESIAWTPELMQRVALVLAQLSETKIDDNWGNRPENSLQAIFRSWMPQTAATLDERKSALAALTRRFPAAGWQVCLAQLEPGPRIGAYNYRPRWRGDASGAGHPVPESEFFEFNRKALELALSWPSHDENTLGDLVESLRMLSQEDQQAIWDLVDRWATDEEDEGRKATLRDRIRRSVSLRQGTGLGPKTNTVDRARHAYALLTPTDPVMRHRWLFGEGWVPESPDELEDSERDFQKREERIKQLRIDALKEIWQAEGLEGITALLESSGAAMAIGFLMADSLIERSAAPDFLEQCLRIEDKGLIGRFDQMVRGFLLGVDDGTRGQITQQLLDVVSPSLACRLLKSSPFQHDTWVLADSAGPEVSQRYWHEVYPEWLRRDSPDLNEAVDRLLEARRPRAAFHAIQHALEQIETLRLARLLQEIATCDSEGAEAYRLDRHYLSEAFDVLQGRANMSEEEMASLELRYVAVLDHTQHGIPNLQKQIASSPALFVQALALVYRRIDGGEDPPEWKVSDPEQESSVGRTAYHLLRGARRIPGTDETGKIDDGKLVAWIKEAQSLCARFGRAEVGDHQIGELLSAAPAGPDGTWPCVELCAALQQCGTPDMAEGMQIGVYNSRGVHARGEGGEQERELASRYRNWSRKLAGEYPYVADLLEGIAVTYDQQARTEDTRSAVERRLRY